VVGKGLELQLRESVANDDSNKHNKEG
jgi:hypothetical protein